MKTIAGLKETWNQLSGDVGMVDEFMMSDEFILFLKAAGPPQYILPTSQLQQLLPLQVQPLLHHLHNIVLLILQLQLHQNLG